MAGSGNTWQGRKRPILYGVLAAFAVAAIEYAVFLASIRSIQTDFADNLQSVFNQVVQDVNATLFPLNELAFDICSADNMRAMEAALFRSLYPKQLMFYVDGIGVCYTGSGILATPVIRPEPDFRSPLNGAEIWVNREIILGLTGEPFTAIIVKYGKYSLMVPADMLQPINNTPFEWRIMFRSQGDPGNVVDIFRSSGAGILDDDNRAALPYERCDADRPFFCLALATTWGMLFDQYAMVIILMGVVAAALGYIMEYKSHQWLLQRTHVSTRVARGFTSKAYHWVFQPIVRLDTGEITGCEVLSRFRDQYGELPPEDYLPVLRDSGHTVEFYRLMFNQALPALERQAALPAGFRVSFNIFPRDIVTDSINQIIDLPVIRATRFRLTLEITEDEHLDDQSAHRNLEKVHQARLQIAVDDFGTGYSNLNQLKKLNCSYLKLDRSYVQELENTPIRATLIPHIVNMAEQLHLEVIAEGIELEAQKHILQELKVKFGQGWLFGKPDTAEALAALMNG